VHARGCCCTTVRVPPHLMILCHPPPPRIGKIAAPPPLQGRVRTRLLNGKGGGVGNGGLKGDGRLTLLHPGATAALVARRSPPVCSPFHVTISGSIVRFASCASIHPPRPRLDCPGTDCVSPPPFPLPHPHGTSRCQGGRAGAGAPATGAAGTARPLRIDGAPGAALSDAAGARTHRGGGRLCLVVDLLFRHLAGW
jgi:hypothetical protein